MKNTFGINIIPNNDPERIGALRRYNILGTPSEESFDDIARLATEIFEVPISLISLVDKEEVYFKANIGMGNAKKTSRGVSLCSLAVLKSEVTVFTNPLDEPCLLTNPNVIGDFGLRFYAGAPITTHDGFLIGTICIIDKKTRQFSKKEELMLGRLANIVMSEIELRLSSANEIQKQQEINQMSEALNEELQASNEELSRNQSEIEELNQELRYSNSEIRAANDELSALNNALKLSQNELTVSNSMLAESEELKNLAIEQAQLGLWHIDVETKSLMSSPRLKDFFGYNANETLSYESAITQIREDYRESVIESINNAIEHATPYDIEYPIIGFRSGRLRWIRAIGKLNSVENNQKSYLSGTAMDITEQKEDEQRKNDFISMVSHELKTPLTSMGAYLQMLTKMAEKRSEGIEINILERALKQTRKMTGMINGFLDMKRAETGKIPLELSVFDMADLIRESEAESSSTISSHQIIFAPVESSNVYADRDKVAQVITNLISNAVKYSLAGSIINVTCITLGSFATVSITDHGIGIREVDMEQLFTRFYRVESQETQNIKGFGIGLYLCHEIIKRHNGKIWVDSIVNRGSTFSFSLPTSTKIN